MLCVCECMCACTKNQSGVPIENHAIENRNSSRRSRSSSQKKVKVQSYWILCIWERKKKKKEITKIENEKRNEKRLSPINSQHHPSTEVKVNYGLIEIDCHSSNNNNAHVKLAMVCARVCESDVHFFSLLLRRFQLRISARENKFQHKSHAKRR